MLKRGIPKHYSNPLFGAFFILQLLNCIFKIVAVMSVKLIYDAVKITNHRKDFLFHTRYMGIIGLASSLFCILSVNCFATHNHEKKNKKKTVQAALF